MTAKGVEDTAFYRYFRLLALNEVGGDPGRFGLSVDGVPPRERCERAPARRCSTTQTHDTKRSADVRARLVALTWIAGRVGERRRPLAVAAPAALDPNDAVPRSARRSSARGRSTEERLEPLPREGAARGKRTSNWLDPDEAAERKRAGATPTS